jgi:TonB family protein
MFGCGLLNAAATSKPEPKYPTDAKAKGITGSVFVYVKIDESGKVYLAKSCGGHPILRRAAIEAAYKARFHGTRMSGKPIKIDGILAYHLLNSSNARSLFEPAAAPNKALQLTAR